MKVLILLFIIAMIGCGQESKISSILSTLKGKQEVAPNVVYLGKDKRNLTAEGYAFITKRSNDKKPDWLPEKPVKDPKLDCYSFLARGARWKVVENYLVDPTNLNMDEASVLQWTEDGLNIWQDTAGTTIFGSRESGVVDGADEVATDGKNELLFATLSDPNVIAVTIVWGVFGGPPKNRQLVEWDMVFNDTGFTFGDATLDPSVMDYLNVMTHESGHAAGLGHAPLECTEETMYPYTTEGETKGRTLHTGDIIGINELY